MRFPEIERIVLDAVEALVGAGVSRKAAEQAARAAEEIAIMDYIETQADIRLLDLFDQHGSTKLAKRRGLCPKTITNHRNEAADRLARKKIGSAGSGQVAA